jgi:crotonobetainyl-CoA:carnitine CoA-transferase CaiB-like acyl-CoA transferase
MPGPLTGIRAVDLGTYAIGPSASAYLGQLGADVIRIENPAGEAFMDFEPTMRGMATSYINSNMAKQSIYLNLKEPEGLQTARRLAATVDVLVENRLPGVTDRLGLGYEEVSALNPGIVYISMPGFTGGGPFAGRPALDSEIQAMSGFASIQGSEGGPPELFRVYAHLDHTTGLFLVQAVLLGLLQRRRTGRGRQIEVGFFASAIFLQSTRIAEFFATDSPPARKGSASSLIAPSQSFPCLDGRYVNISASDEEMWRRLCTALDMPGLAEEERFATNQRRLENREQLASAITRRTGKAPAWWWVMLLRRHRVACGPVYMFEEMVRDPHLRSQEAVVDVATPWGPVVHGGIPWRFGSTPCRPIEGTHEPGSDENEVMRRLAELEGAEKGSGE